MIQAMVTFVREGLAAQANPEKAGPMAAYMKTDMPFYGVQKPGRTPVFKALVRDFPPADHQTYERAVLALWNLDHREEKYAALHLAAGHKRFVKPESLPLYERLVREGAWWDLVDTVVGTLIAPLQQQCRPRIRPVMDRWIDDDFLWIRRAAIISQLGHKDQTDAAQLFEYCLARAHEKEFFVRKAIGWALRSYSYAAPEAVRDFLTTHRDRLSGLSYREGAKRLVREGLMT